MIGFVFLLNKGLKNTSMMVKKIVLNYWDTNICGYSNTSVKIVLLEKKQREGRVQVSLKSGRRR